MKTPGRTEAGSSATRQSTPWRPWEALRSRPVVARVVENISWLVIERLLILVTGFLVNVWFVRYLGPERFGLYSYATSFVALFAALSPLGMDSVVVREMSLHPESEGAILGTALGLRTAAGLLTGAAAVVAVVQVRADSATRGLVAIVAATCVSSALTVFEFWFHARMAARRLVITRTAVMIASHGARAVLILVGASLAAFGALYAAASAVTACALYVAYVRARSAGDRLHFDPAWARKLFSDSWPLIFMAVAVAVYMKVDQVMLAEMSGDRENGIYATAVALSELWYFIPIAVGAAAFPVIVKARHQMDSATFEAKMQTFYDGMAAVGYAVAVPVFACAGPIVRVLYGPEYAGAVPVLRIHVVSFVFVCIGLARGRYLISENMTRFAMYSTIMAAVLNVVLNLVLIPRYGAAGAAWSTLVSYGATNYLSGFLSGPVRRHTWLLTRALLLPIRPASLFRNVIGREHRPG